LYKLTLKYFAAVITIHTHDQVFDAMERVHQCATVQLDFQLPIRFDLNYRGDAQVEGTTAPTAAAAAAAASEPSNSDAMDVDTDGNTTAAASAAASAVKPKGVSKNRPVMVHRAMLGSLERMIAVLTEHYGGRWPFWLSPRQAMVVPVGQVMSIHLNLKAVYMLLLTFTSDVAE
jgi:threonyl-tRNA synthetase